jgi:hypothetical protein
MRARPLHFHNTQMCAQAVDVIPALVKLIRDETHEATLRYAGTPFLSSLLASACHLTHTGPMDPVWV